MNVQSLPSATTPIDCEFCTRSISYAEDGETLVRGPSGKPIPQVVVEGNVNRQDWHVTLQLCPRCKSPVAATITFERGQTTLVPERFPR